MKKQILLLCLALISLCGYAQQITVKGVVTSATDQQPLIGTTVQVKGTGTGTITGIDGDYTLPNVDKNAVLVFSSIGFESQEIAVGGRTTINVVLKEAAELLDEVVVIGYGAVKKSDLTSSIATVKGDEITETVTGNAMDALQGKVNGVQVTSGGGPGATPKVLIRGVTTVNGTNPLYVVDGMPVGDNINFLNSNDIASMEVLKDASAAAIYGTRASNGVILITTKKGKTGKARINWNSSVGFQTVAKPNIAGAAEYKEVFNTRYTNDGLSSIWNDTGATTNPGGTDWWPLRMARADETGFEREQMNIRYVCRAYAFSKPMLIMFPACKINWITIISLIAGSSTYQICCKRFAPSTMAASSSSLLALDNAAVYMMDAQPAPCQIPLAI